MNPVVNKTIVLFCWLRVDDDTMSKVRMGYNPGQCLGKDQQGRLEPVTIAMR